ncbi:hypothetical protein ADUPG1_010086 [Aduncisulcus paluster]|uniref:Uncharacterized protein n=1 Tax=Aduncisulcus paluster TaxID=2918883 RepID=A0ABQ5KYX7_9EUKA|nr:hypothetical protein ADUPG1_010086 [Aduncisulcus paluster]
MQSTEELTKEIEVLIVSIKRTDSRPAIKSLYEGSHSRLKTIFDEFTSSPSSAVPSARDLFALCFECLSLFVKHKVTEDDGTPDEDDFEVILDSSSIQDMIDSFLPSMIRKWEEEEGAKTAESRVNSITKTLFSILSISTTRSVLSQCIDIFPQISTLLSKMFILGLFEKFDDSFVEDILLTCRNIAFAKDDPTKNSLLSILLPHILPWMKKYPDKESFFLWMNILKNITNDKSNIDYDKDRSSQLWFVFHPVLAIIKDTASKGITFDDDAVIRCLCFLGNLSCIPSQAIEVHDCIKDGLIDSWFEIVKRKKSEGLDPNCWGTIYWSNLISMLSTVPSIIPQLSPKYDANMECSLKKWSGLVEAIVKCPDSESSSILYHKHREDILSVFLASQSKSEIEEHKREIVVCVECLDRFVGHTIAGNHICLPIPDLNNLIDTFIDHLSRIEEVLEEAVDEVYCTICVDYSFKVKDKRDSFLLKIFSTFHRILERGSKKRLGHYIVLNILKTLRNISSSSSTSTRSSIFTLIIPYIKDWLRMYNDNDCYGKWMYILSQITILSDGKPPNTSLCSETWHLFHPVLDIVKREFDWDKIVEDDKNNITLFSDDREQCLGFFFHLCCDPTHAIEIYNNVKDLLEGWFEVMKRSGPGSVGILYWSKLISMFSTVPSIIPQLSPKYDAKMLWCNREKWYCSIPSYNQYLSNISSFVFSSYLSSTLFHSVPMVSFLPSIETSLCPEKDGYSYASHVCSVMNLHKTIPHRKNKISCYHDIISGKEMQIQHVLKRDGSSSQDILTHSSLIQYTSPPQHMLVKMPFDDERSLRQSVYDLIERTGGGVEVMFEQGSLCCSFEEYDQEAWRNRMEDIEEEEESEEYYNFEESLGDWP